MSDLLILANLRKDARAKLTTISKQAKIPVSTIFDKINTYTMNGLINKSTSLINFEKLGYQVKALMVFSMITCVLNICHTINTQHFDNPILGSLLHH